MLRPDGSPVLIDFGSARAAMGEHTKTRPTYTPGYAPIEQYVSDLRGQGAWTDVYSLGATLYRALTGMVPQESTARVAATRSGQLLTLCAGYTGQGYWPPSILP